MSKKEELEQMVRGKGIEALRPEIDESSPENTTFARFQVEKKEQLFALHPDKIKSSFLTDQPEKKQQTEEIQINQNCTLAKIIPGVNEQELIQTSVSENLHQIHILDAHIEQEGKRGTVFKSNLPLVLNICCYASGLLGQLKPELDIIWITYDIIRMQVQPVYKFCVKVKPLWQLFQIKYQIQPNVTGWFRFHVIVDLEAADLFWFKEGELFKIG